MTGRPPILRGAALLSVGVFPAAEALAQPADGGMLQEVSAEEEGDCARVTIRFSDRIRLLEPVTEGRGLEARLRVQTVTDRAESAQDSLAPPTGGTPIRSITYESDAIGGAVLLVRFDREVRYRVSLGPREQAVILSLSEGIGCEASPHAFTPLTEAERATSAGLEADAEAAIIDRNDTAALALLQQSLARPANDYTPRALELVGLIHARNGRAEEARRVFEEHLQRFPASEGRTRVEQRLAAIAGPAEEQAAAARTLGDVEVVDDAWKTDLRGIVSQFYYRDESRSKIVDARRPDVTEIVDHRLNVDQILSAADITLSASKGDTRIQLRAAGAITQDFRPVGLVGAVRGGGDTERISLLYLDVEDGGTGLSARFGRQWLAGSGVFGRFDGARARVRLSPTVGLTAVAGFPVQTPRDTHIDDDRFFYGVSLDVDWPGESVETSLYWLDQRANGLTDRKAIGVTGRFTAERLSLFGIVDYDIHFERLSSAYLSVNYQLSERSSVTLSADYLHYPQLTTTSAIIGQPVPDLGVVKQRFDRAFIKQLAKDRSQTSRSLSLTYSQALSPRWQLNADMAVARLGDAPASGGVLAIEGSGTDFYAGAQIVGTDVLMEGATVAAALRYADVQRFRIYAADVGARLPVGPKLKVDPRLRVGYRDDKIGRGHQWTLQPSIRATYPIARSLELDAEAGVTFIDQRIDDPVTEGSRDERSWFVNVGYRFTF